MTRRLGGWVAGRLEPPPPPPPPPAPSPPLTGTRPLIDQRTDKVGFSCVPHGTPTSYTLMCHTNVPLLLWGMWHGEVIPSSWILVTMPFRPQTPHVVGLLDRLGPTGFNRP